MGTEHHEPEPFHRRLRTQRTDVLLELGLLAVLVVAFGLAIFLIRRGAAAERAAGLTGDR